MEEDAFLIKSKRLQKKARRRKIARIMGIIFLCIIAMSSCLNFSLGNRRSFFSQNRENAKWIEENGQKYLFLEAKDEFELGRLEGKFLSAKIANLKRIIQMFGTLNSQYGFSYSDMVQRAKDYEKHIPSEYKEEMRGMHEAILGVTYDDILLQNCFVDILYGQYYPDGEIPPLQTAFEMGCSVLGFKNNDSVIIGQNFDFNNIFKHTLAFVHHRIVGKQAQFTLKVGGILSIPCGQNSAGTSIFINVVRSNMIAPSLMPLAIRSRIGFDTAKNPDEFLEIILSDVSTLSMNLLIGNSTNLISLEVLPGNCSISRPISAVNTNTYTNPHFQRYLLDPNYSKIRQTTAESLLLNYTTDNYLSQNDFISIMSNPLIYQINNGIMGVSTLVCTSNKFFCEGIPTILENYPQIPLFY